MPWQRFVIDVANEVDPVTGWWAYDEIVIVVPRQAGKTTLKIPLYAHRLSIIPSGELWMTAQNGTKARDRWLAASQLMLRMPALERKLKRLVSISHESLTYRPTGAVLRPFAPNEESMHGDSPELVDVDEWWKFDAVAAKALKDAYAPGLLTKNAQAWKTSTMGTAASAGLNDDVAAGRAAVEMGRRSGTAYFEWSLDDLIGGVPYDELPDAELVEACIAIHPAIGFHPTAPAEKMRHFIRTQIAPDKLGRAGVIRAFGNRIPDGSSGWRVIPQAAWVAAMIDRAIPHGVPVGLGFEVDLHGRDAAVAVAWRDDAGVATVEVVQVLEGTRWVKDAVIALEDRWNVVQTGVQNSGPARDAADSIETQWKREAAEAGKDPLELLRLSQPDFAAACERVRSEVVPTKGAQPTVRHIGQPELNTAAEHVGKRRVGALGSWAWQVDSDVSIVSLVAVTAALWAVDHPRETEPEPGPFKIR